MMNLLTFAIGVIASVMLARLNKSNSLFWTLFTAMMLGFVGGSIYTRMATSKEKKCSFIQNDVTQLSSVNSGIIYFDDAKETLVVNTTNTVSRIYSEKNMKECSDPNRFCYESNVGNDFNEYNTS